MGKDETKEEKKDEKKIGEPIVMKEFPKLDARVFIDNDGIEHPIVLEDEAQTEMLTILRHLNKVWGK